MKQIATFFTIYWCVYFPTCIAYNELSFFSSVDEAMTMLLISYTLMQKGKKWTNMEPWKEYMTFFGILAFYVIYSLMIKVNVAEAVFYDIIQQIRPWSIIYCTWILNPQFSEKQKKWMLRTMVLTVITFLIYHPEVSANISAGAENRNAPFGQLAICTSMAWFLFTEQTKRNRNIAVLIAITGMMSMKFKYYGEFGAWMFMMYYMKDKFKWGGAQMGMQITLLASLVITLGWERFNAYYIEGLDNESLARPLMNKATMQILMDYFPFGCGLGSFATLAGTKYYSPIWHQYGLDTVWGLQQYGTFGNCVMGFHGDNFFATFGQIGVLGIFLFLVFWKRRLKQFQLIEDMRYYKVAMTTFFCIVIEWFGDSSWLSGKGMGYCMLIALCLNANRTLGRVKC